MGNLPLLTDTLFRTLITAGVPNFRYHFSSRATGLFWPDVFANSYSRLSTAMPHFGREVNYPRFGHKIRNVADNFALFDKALDRHLIAAAN